MKADPAAEQAKKKALIGTAAALIVTVAAWFFIDHQTDRGLARLNHIDSVYAVCNVDYKRARNSSDTSRIDAKPLSAPIDSGKQGAPQRCGDLRRPADALESQDSVRRSQATRNVMPTRDGR
ncbi:MAG: hypothetical protein ABI852_18820 [Gemmatimonadaceae bacterium]